MNIENNKVVSFHYQLREIDGDYTEDSSGGSPMLYLHGHRGILPGLEDAMLGRSAGDKFSVSLGPETAYGPRNDAAIQRVPLKHLIDHPKPKSGDIVTVNTRNGKVKATVLKVGRFNIDIDTNHPLAGKSLEFNVEILSVREATMDEVAHRHAHGPGGHQH
ncbi:peptidylprolyl isomerase [Chromatiales bacterium (ex Bugula neritina AB1)]|nr:peptidylprolyl isomerase [Chromatiales bacterium (ex Bugula neritina AB1)]